MQKRKWVNKVHYKIANVNPDKNKSSGIYLFIQPAELTAKRTYHDIRTQYPCICVLTLTSVDTRSIVGGA